MKKYELIVIYNSGLGEEEIAKYLDDVQKTVIAQKGEIESIEKWGVRDIATEFNKHKTGFYVLINFNGDNVCLDKLNAILRVNEKIVRYLIANRVIMPEPVPRKK